jgi:NCS1 family nucleobase:cation symporter-1
MIADYYFIRKKELIVEDLYQQGKSYFYQNGYNTKAITALLLGILPNIPGFLVTIKAISVDAVPGWLTNLYHYGWFVGFFISALVYFILMKNKK